MKGRIGIQLIDIIPRGNSNKQNIKLRQNRNRSRKREMRMSSIDLEPLRDIRFKEWNWFSTLGKISLIGFPSSNNSSKFINDPRETEIDNHEEIPQLERSKMRRCEYCEESITTYKYSNK